MIAFCTTSRIEALARQWLFLVLLLGVASCGKRVSSDLEGIYTGRGGGAVWRLEIQPENRYSLGVGGDEKLGPYDRRGDTLYLGYDQHTVTLFRHLDTLLWVEMDSMQLVRQRP